MDANEARSNEANSVAKVDMKLEIVVIPVSDVDRAKQFYGRLGWRLDADYATPDEPYLFGRLRISGPDPEHRSYRSFASFNDPDGNGWLFQELTTRLARAHRLRGDKLRVEERSGECASACSGCPRRAREAHRRRAR